MCVELCGSDMVYCIRMKRKQATRRGSSISHTSIIGILVAISGTVALGMMIIYLFDIFQTAPIM